MIENNNIVKAKVLFVLVVITLSVIISLGGYFYYQNEKLIIRTEKYNELTAIANLKVNQIENWYKERLSEAQFFTQNEPYKDIAKQISNGNAKQMVLLRKTLSHILTNNRYNNIFMLNSKGELIFCVDSTFSKLDAKSIFFTQKVYENKSVVFSDFYICTTHSTIHLDIVAPILSNSNEVIATLVFRVNPDDYLYPLIQNWPTPSKTAETLLVRKAEDSVLFLNRLRHSINSPLSLSIPLTKVEVPAVQAILGAKGIYEGIDYRGVNVLSIILPIIETPWFMVAKVDSNEIFAELNARATLIFILTFFLILFFSALIAWFYHYRQRNIYRKLLESEVELHQSQEEFKATLYSIGDGVITTDKDGNVKRLNPVAEMLTGWKEKDAKGEKLEKVFNIISEETRKTVENPVFKVLKEGLIVGLANHTLLISKNGTEIPIADSGAPIKNSKGEIVGVVMVFRDQTEERKSHSAIIASETRYRRLFESAKDGILILDAETGKIMEVNPFLMQLLGFSQEQFLDKILWEIGLFKDIIANKDMFLELQQHEYVRYDNLPIETKAGKTIEVEFISNVYLVNGQKVIQCNIRDISQRKHSEKALKESEEKFSNILNNMTDVVWSLSWPELKPEFLSPSVEKLYGRPVLDFMENPTLFIETVHPDDKHLMDNALNQLKESGEAKRECRVIRPDGSIIWIYDKSKLIYDEKKQPVRVEGIAQDITELKQAERDLITLKNDLENKVKEKTKELNERVEELERFRDATIDRELRMKELRDEIKRLKGEI